MTTDHVIGELRAAKRGSAELSVRAYRALTGLNTYRVGGREGPECGQDYVSVSGLACWGPRPCITTNLGAAWEAAENLGHEILLQSWSGGMYRESGPFFRYSCTLECAETISTVTDMVTPALAVIAALLMSIGKRT